MSTKKKVTKKPAAKRTPRDVVSKNDPRVADDTRGGRGVSVSKMIAARKADADAAASNGT